MRLHAIVDELETARLAVEGGATVVQWRLKDAPRVDVVERGRATRSLCARHGVMLGLSASTPGEARIAEGRADYIGAGPVWPTPSKPDADAPIGLEGLREICGVVAVPVVAIGGIDPSNAADCIRVGAAGVAVIRAARQAHALRRAIDEAL